MKRQQKRVMLQILKYPSEVADVIFEGELLDGNGDYEKLLLMTIDFMLITRMSGTERETLFTRSFS